MSKEKNYFVLAQVALDVLEEEGQEVYEFFRKEDAAVLLMDLYSASDSPLGIEKEFDGNMAVQMNDGALIFRHQNVWGRAWGFTPIAKYESVKEDMQMMLQLLQNAMVDWMNKMKDGE